MARRCSTLAIALVLALLAPATAASAAATGTTTGEPTSGYTQTPPAVEAEKPNSEQPKAGEKPYSESSPSSTEKPSQEKPANEQPVVQVKENVAKAGTLPFTGFDLRWELTLGMLALGAGVAILIAQRRRERQPRRAAGAVMR